MNGSPQSLLQHQLLPLLDTLSSEEHQKILIDHHILPRQLPRKLDQLLKRLQKGGDLLSPTIDELVQVCVQITEQLRAKADQLGVTQLSEHQLTEFSDEWQTLEQEFDIKAGEQQESAQSMHDGLVALVQQWKGPQNIENIVTTIIADQPSSIRLMMVDKQNYARLGLPPYKLGQKYLVFDSQNQEQIRQLVDQIGDDFSSIFAENARNNLERLDQSYRYQGDVGLRLKIRSLAQKLSPRNPIINNNYRTEIIRFATHNIPNFTPADWQWSDIVKVRRPYKPLLFGLYRTKQQKQSQITTLSVRKLCEHFRKMGCEFYTSILESASLLFTSDAKVMSQEGKEFVNMSIALQIEQNRAILRNALISLHQLRQSLALEQHHKPGPPMS
jgi:DNA-directed RNA polymerase subunit H (RpoH/RPB5)